MARADTLAVQGGMSGAQLMENAGQAVKSVVLAEYPAYGAPWSCAGRETMAATAMWRRGCCGAGH